ncbi:MAG: DNA-processing protein DprA [Prevotella sp.]|jgi:DNA processing protein|nr:DNA-processing protein DprA [Prevotella sp.]
MDSSSDKRLYQIALTMIAGVGDITARNILQAVGDEERIFKSGKKDLLHKTNLPAKIIEEILDPAILERAAEELEFVEKNSLKLYFISDKDYPGRLRECADAPVLFYFKGDTGFNAKKIISIVGTRKSTPYGNSFCDTFLQDISAIAPDTLIVSGLAYGIDIQAHRAALKHNLPTVGVLAHGLDIIYPSAHRQTAVEMVHHGGVLSEFRSKTEPDRFNFVRRNRIVAGICDAVIVVESDEKGGSLITAEIANSYCKDVFAVPGKMTDKYSRGCNKLIASHRADLFQSTGYFLQQMGWDEQSKKKKPRQQQLFVILSDDEQAIVDKLSAQDSLHIDLLARDLNLPAYRLFSLLLDMEMKGIIKNMPGNMYALA